MNVLGLAFAQPLVLAALLALPAIWLLIRLTPPRPEREAFPPLAILAAVLKREETPARSPWWLTLIRLLLAAAVIAAMAGPLYNPAPGRLSASGPLALLVDNSWATVADWDQRVETATQLIDAAGRDGLPVALAFTAGAPGDAAPVSAAEARRRLAAATPQPLPATRGPAIAALSAGLDDLAPGTLAFLTDGLQESGAEDALAALAALEPADLRLIAGSGDPAAILSAANGADGLTVTAGRLPGPTEARMPVSALDRQGRPIGTGEMVFAAGEATASARIEAPFELRNDFSRLVLGAGGDAGRVHLLDDGFRRRRVALVSGEGGDQLQPLLSPLYYIERALKPYADLARPASPDLATAIPDLLKGNVSALVLADVGRLPPEAVAPLGRWIANGGTLIRFAGPRLAAAPADDPLLPVALRQGERRLGGALSWAEPQPLAEFPATGPFAGMATASDVRIKRQVLAEPVPGLEARTWASLADGTPLVTVKDQGAGRIVLFHVSAETAWSDLPLSGSFVEMLRRVVQLSRATVSAAAPGEAAQSALPPYRLLSADGRLVGETGSARPLTPPKTGRAAANADHPPGLYGSEDSFTAVNLLPETARLAPLPVPDGLALTRAPLASRDSIDLAPWLIGAAVLLFIVDGLAVLVIHGVIRLPRRSAAAAALVLATLAAGVAADPRPASAADSRPGDEVLLSRLDTTHLAYVITGEAEVDTVSRQGLAGLSEYLGFRTALEPGPPEGVDIASDELSVFPLIYWPISATAPMPSSAAISRIDAYMRAGGSVLFDTRDAYDVMGETGSGANAERLQQILANLDIPPLEPVPAGHVLGKSFFLLDSFPGRYANGPLWIAARQDADTVAANGSRSGDGVSPILITGNDLAGAWAVNDYGQPVLPTVPPDEGQREMAYRTGVNIMMYMLTGNYKADQVHVPALLERLGQ